MFASKPRMDVAFRLILIVVILFSTPVNFFSAQAANAKATPTPITTIVPTVTIDQPTSTGTAGPTTETPTPDIATPIAITDSPTPPIITTLIASDTASPMSTVATEPALSLSMEPDSLTRNSTYELTWSITGLIPEEHKQLLLQITLPEIFTIAGKYDGNYDETSHILTIAAATLSGQLELATGDSVSNVVLEAALLDGAKILTETKLPLSSAEQFLVDSQGGEISAMDGKIKVEIPKDTLPETAVIEIGTPSGDDVPPYSLLGKPFEIEAYGEQSKNDLDHFSKDLSIIVSYADLGIPENLEGELNLYWFNTETEEWEALPTTVEKETKTLRAITDHFTVFDMNVSNWQASHLPTIDPFQVSSFTGAGTYSLPIEAPPGPGGFQPSLSLSYNSQVVDQSTLNTQASWVGMGWSLVVGDIELDTHGTGTSTSDDTLFLNVDGVSTRILKDTSGVYHASDENFWRITKDSATNAWTIQDKQGNSYIFGSAGYTFAYPYDAGNCTHGWEARRWLLKKVTNLYGQEINYSYAAQTKDVSVSEGCSWNKAQAVTATYPYSITYGKYQILFDRGTDPVRNRQDYSSAWDTDAIFHEYQKYRLQNIYIKQDADGIGEYEKLIRSYEFTYKADTDGDIIFSGHAWTAGGKTTTLKSVRQYGVDGTIALPAVTFTYGDNLHLTKADNGYGGVVEFDYGVWYYPTEARKSYSIEVKFGQSGGFPCKIANDLMAWSAPVGTIDCGSGGGNPLYIRGPLGIATSTDIRNATTSQYLNHNRDLIRPGGVYKVTATMNLKSGMSARVGLWDGVRYTWGPAGATTAYITLPVDANRADPLIEETGGDYATKYATVSNYKFKLLTSIYRVTTKRIKDGNGHTYSFSYAYNNGATDTAGVNDALNAPFTTCDPNNPSCYDYVERFSEFRGNSLVTETNNDTGGKTVTAFYQDDVFKGRLGWVSGQNGLQILSLQYSYYTQFPLPVASVTVPGCPTCPYIGLTRNFIYTNAVENRIYANSGSYDATRTEYTYETTHGNLTQQLEKSWNGSGWNPYRNTITDYFPNTTGVYLTGLPARQQVKDSTGTVIAETLNLYDGANTYTTAPTIGRLTAKKTWTSGTNYSQVTFGYDAWGNRTTVTTYTGYGTASAIPTAGAATIYTCYGGGGTLGGIACNDDGYHTYPLSTTNALLQTTFWTYDYALGVPLTETDPNGAVTRADYDRFGRITNVYLPNPATGSVETTSSLTIAYQDSFPFTTTITQKIDNTPRFYTVQRVYDGMGRQTKITSGGTIVDTIYESALVTKQSVPYQGTSPNLFTITTINPAAHTTTVQAPDGTSSVTFTDGLKTIVTDGRGDKAEMQNDVWGRILTITPKNASGDAVGPNLTYTYDILNHMLTASHGTSMITAMKYDNAGRKINMDDSDMGKAGTYNDGTWAWSYQYDALGNLTRQTDARAQRICLYYDSLNRLIGKHYRVDDNCPSNPSYDVSFGYDSGTNGKGQRTGMIYGSGLATWTYDARGRMISESKVITGVGTFNTSWTYNAANLANTMTYPGGSGGQAGETVTYGYNSRMLLESVSGTNTYVSSTIYDGAGRIDVRTFGNSTQSNYDYFPWNTQGGRLQYLKSGSTGNPTSLQNLTYSYDAVGNLSTILDSLAGPQTQSFTYDALDRLSTASAIGGTNGTYSQGFGYDPTTGNPETNGNEALYYLDANHMHAVTARGSNNTYSYDLNGNMTCRVEGGNTYKQVYNAENQLTSIQKMNGGCNGTAIETTSFIYDGDGRRVKATVNGTTTIFVGGYYELTGSTVTKYYFAGAQRVAMRKYTIPQPMTLEYLFGDHLGSTSITTDSSGTKVSEIRYKPYGEIRYSWTSGAVTTPAYKLINYTFTGQYSYMDDPTTSGVTEGVGLMFYNARFYSPYINQFTQPDSIIPDQTNPQSWNRYSYVTNNPLRYTDPTGHRACGDGEEIDCFGNKQDPSRNPHPPKPTTLPRSEKDGDGPITDLILQLPGSAEDWSILSTGLDSLAWFTDIYAAGTVIYAYLGGAALPAPLIAVGLPEVPLVTGFAGMAIAELYIQPVLFVGNVLATFSTGATLVSDTKSGHTRIEEANFSTSSLNSMALTNLGWQSNEAFLSLAVQSVAVANDLGWASLPFPMTP